MSDSDALPRIPGVNVREVLARLGLSWGELRVRLLRFAAEHGSSLALLRQALDAGDHVEARRLAVEIGIAGANFGANGLWGKARALESALRTGERYFEHWYDALEMEFEGLVKSVQRLEETGGINEVRDVIRSLDDFVGLRFAFGELQAALRKPDWPATDAGLKRVRELGIPPDMLEGFRELEKLIKDRRAADALDLIGILKQNLDQ